jgi:hypothetical protein
MRPLGSDWTGQPRLLMVPLLAAAFLLPPLFLTFALVAGLLFALTSFIQTFGPRVPAMLIRSLRRTA